MQTLSWLTIERIHKEVYAFFYLWKMCKYSRMTSSEIRKRFLEFFEKRGHAVIPSASLVPNKEDTSVLFNTAGMQPLVPYLL